MITVVLGASTNERRYSFMATTELKNHNYNVIPVGIKKGSIEGIKIQNNYPEDIDIHTLAMYLSPENQKIYYKNIETNPPKRVIFNPGTYNPELEKILNEKNIDVIRSCVLIMLSNDNYLGD